MLASRKKGFSKLPMLSKLSTSNRLVDKCSDISMLGIPVSRCYMRWAKAILWDDTGMEFLPTLRTVLDE